MYKPVNQVLVCNGLFAGAAALGVNIVPGPADPPVPLTPTTPTQAAVNAFHVPGAPVPPPGWFPLGAYGAINPTTRTAYNTAIMPGAPPANNNGIQFVVQNNFRGYLTSETIRARELVSVNQSPFRLRTPRIVTFNLPYSSVVAAHNTFQGQVVTIKMDISKGHWDLPKQPILASTRVPGVFNAAAPLNATPAQIQQTHFELLELLIKADNAMRPGGMFINAVASRFLSMSANYLQVVVVGTFKDVNTINQYSKYRPIHFEIALIDGFGDNIFVDKPGTLVGYTAATVANQAYLGEFLASDDGAGYPDIVRSHEYETAQLRGHRALTGFVEQVQTFADDALFYDGITLAYKTISEYPYKTGTSNKTLTIYFNRQGAAPPDPLANAAMGIAAPPAFPAGAYTFANVFDGVANRPVIYAGGAAAVIPVNIAVNAAGTSGEFNRLYVPQAIPAQGANAAIFCSFPLGNVASFISNSMAGLA